jgi:hypothetical protein
VTYQPRATPWVTIFTPALFWDVDREELDIEKNRAFIVNVYLSGGTIRTGSC